MKMTKLNQFDKFANQKVANNRVPGQIEVDWNE